MRNLNWVMGLTLAHQFFFEHSPLCDDSCKLGLKTDFHGLVNFTRYNKCRGYGIALLFIHQKPSLSGSMVEFNLCWIFAEMAL